MPAKITIIPTSHIAKDSIRLVKEAVERENPDCIAVELDPGRYQAMLQGEGSKLDALQALGPFTFLFYLILKRVQDSLGKAVGVIPGSEMLESVNIGREKGISVAFIDRDISETFFKIKAIPTKEKARLVLFALKAAAGLKISVGKYSNADSIDLSKVPPEKVIDEALLVLKQQFPWLHRILLEERNQHMANRIMELSQSCKNMVVVVGAGHAKGINEMLDRMDTTPSILYSFTVD